MKNILFIDIETISDKADFYALDQRWRELWRQKARKYARSTEELPLSDKRAATLYHEKASLHPEFSRIVCIGMGVVRDGHVKTHALCGLDEKGLLEGFVSILNKSYPDPQQHALCGHNIKGFDIPFICKRSKLHSIQLPALLQVQGKKPWELAHLKDTMEAWRYGDMSYTSLDLLCALWGIETPKAGDVTGENLGEYFYGSEKKQEALQGIADYCLADVKATALLWMKIN